MRVGILARVSDRQQADNTSIEGQQDRCRAFALEHGFDVIAEKAETVTGAARWGARTAFNALLEMGDRGALDAILVDIPDRLGRGRALATLLDRAERHGLEVFFADGSKIDSVSLGVAIITSGKEREDIGRRTRQGKLKTVEHGGIVQSQAPYGYQIVREYDPQTGKKINSKVELVPGEMRHVVSMYHWLVDERQTLHGIRVKLYENKVLPPSLKDKYKTWEAVPEGTSKLWHRTSVRNVLSNSAYIGRWAYNRAKTTRVETDDGMKQKRLGKRDKNEWLYVEIPAIISEELFEQAQAILGKNKEQQVGRKPSRSKFLLKRLLFCHCGWRMIGVTYRSGNGAYRCNRDVTRVETLCDAPRLNQELVENVVWDFIKRLLMNPQRLLDQLEKSEKEAEKQNAPLREQAETLQADILKSEARLERALDALLDGTMDKATYTRKKSEIEKAISDIGAELAEAQRRLRRPPLTEELKEEIIKYYTWVAQKQLKNITFEDKRQMLLMLDVRVTHLPEKEAVRVEGAFPTEELSITS